MYKLLIILAAVFSVCFAALIIKLIIEEVAFLAVCLEALIKLIREECKNKND